MLQVYIPCRLKTPLLASQALEEHCSWLGAPRTLFCARQAWFCVPRALFCAACATRVLATTFPRLSLRACWRTSYAPLGRRLHYVNHPKLPPGVVFAVSGLTWPRCPRLLESQCRGSRACIHGFLSKRFRPCSQNRGPAESDNSSGCTTVHTAVGWHPLTCWPPSVAPHRSQQILGH